MSCFLPPVQGSCALRVGQTAARLLRPPASTACAAAACLRPLTKGRCCCRRVWLGSPHLAAPAVATYGAASALVAAMTSRPSCAGWGRQRLLAFVSQRRRRVTRKQSRLWCSQRAGTDWRRTMHLRRVWRSAYWMPKAAGKEGPPASAGALRAPRRLPLCSNPLLPAPRAIQLLPTCRHSASRVTATHESARAPAKTGVPQSQARSGGPTLC